MRKRNCVVKRFWESGTPYIQFGGWLVMMCGIIVATMSMIEKANAFDERLTNVEHAITEIAALEGKLDLVIKLLGGAK